MNERELATVLAALRLWQSVKAVGTPEDPFDDIASDGGELQPLDLDEIDELCERLNCGPTTPQQRRAAICFHAKALEALGYRCEVSLT